MGQADIELGYIGAAVGQRSGETVLEAVKRVLWQAESSIRDTPIGKHGPYGTHTNLDGSPVLVPPAPEAKRETCGLTDWQGVKCTEPAETHLCLPHAKALAACIDPPDSKDVDDLKDQRPRLKDLQGSRGMRQAADNVVLPLRDWGPYETASSKWHRRVAGCASRSTVKRTGDEWPACDCGLDEFRFSVVEQTCQIINAILDGDPGPHTFPSETLTATANRVAALRRADSAT